jgi:hypothetical protein
VSVFPGAAGNPGPIEGYSGDLELAHRWAGFSATKPRRWRCGFDRPPGPRFGLCQIDGASGETTLPGRGTARRDAQVCQARSSRCPATIHQEDVDRMTRLRRTRRRESPRRPAFRGKRVGAVAGRSPAPALGEPALNATSSRLILEPVRLEVAVLGSARWRWFLTNGAIPRRSAPPSKVLVRGDPVLRIWQSHGSRLYADHARVCLRKLRSGRNVLWTWFCREGRRRIDCTFKGSPLIGRRSP